MKDNEWSMRPKEEWKPVQFPPLDKFTPGAIYYACPVCNVAFIVPVEHECPPSWMRKPAVAGWMGNVNPGDCDPEVAG